MHLTLGRFAAYKRCAFIRLTYLRESFSCGFFLFPLFLVYRMAWGTRYGIRAGYACFDVDRYVACKHVCTPPQKHVSTPCSSSIMSALPSTHCTVGILLPTYMPSPPLRDRLLRLRTPNTYDPTLSAVPLPSTTAVLTHCTNTLLTAMSRIDVVQRRTHGTYTSTLDLALRRTTRAHVVPRCRCRCPAMISRDFPQPGGHLGTNRVEPASYTYFHIGVHKR